MTHDMMLWGTEPQRDDASREAWGSFQRGFPKVRVEFERALNEVIGRVNVTDRSGRFVVGDAVEYLVAAAFYSAGVPLTPRGSGNADDYDIDTCVGELKTTFSVKSSFPRKIGTIRLKNKMVGLTAWTWSEPTLFVIRETGIVYAEPKTHVQLAAKVHDTKDAYSLNVRDIRAHAVEHPECLVTATVPVNPGTGKENAGRALFRDIIDHPSYPTLRSILERENLRSGRAVFEALDDLKGRLERGEITPQQYQALVDRVVSQ